MHDLSLLTRLAIAGSLVFFLPRLMQRIRLPGVLGFILAGMLLGPKMTGVPRLARRLVEFFGWELERFLGYG
jgi:Kef-type K+ transport system membrane component KefB